MTQGYSDPSRESDPHALPDIEVFQLTAQEVAEQDEAAEGQDLLDEQNSNYNADIDASLRRY